MPSGTVTPTASQPVTRIQLPLFAPTALVGTQQISAQGILGGCYFINNSGAQNDAWTWANVFMSAGTWSIIPVYIQDASAAIQTYLIDGVSVGTLDAYHAGEVDNVVGSITGIAVASDGLKSVQVKVATRNAAATNWYMILQALLLYRTSA